MQHLLKLPLSVVNASCHQIHLPLCAIVLLLGEASADWTVWGERGGVGESRWRPRGAEPRGQTRGEPRVNTDMLSAACGESGLESAPPADTKSMSDCEFILLLKVNASLDRYSPAIFSERVSERTCSLPLKVIID